jgi:hypothetical protein
MVEFVLALVRFLSSTNVLSSKEYEFFNHLSSRFAYILLFSSLYIMTGRIDWMIIASVLFVTTMMLL